MGGSSSKTESNEMKGGNFIDNHNELNKNINAMLNKQNNILTETINFSFSSDLGSTIDKYRQNGGAYDSPYNSQMISDNINVEPRRKRYNLIGGDINDDTINNLKSIVNKHKNNSHVHTHLNGGCGCMDSSPTTDNPIPSNISNTNNTHNAHNENNNSNDIITNAMTGGGSVFRVKSGKQKSKTDKDTKNSDSDYDDDEDIDLDLSDIDETTETDDGEDDSDDNDNDDNDDEESDSDETDSDTETEDEDLTEYNLEGGVSSSSYKMDDSEIMLKSKPIESDRPENYNFYNHELSTSDNYRNYTNRRVRRI